MRCMVASLTLVDSANLLAMTKNGLKMTRFSYRFCEFDKFAESTILATYLFIQ